MRQILEQIREELRANADEAIRESSQRFFKEPIACYGMKSATVSAIAKKVKSALKGASKMEVFALCDELWRSGFMEECGIACQLAHAQQQRYEAGDLRVFEGWIDSYVNNWATCDTLCNHTVGSFIMLFPEHMESLKQWTASGNRWEKRAAAVTLIIPARKGLFLADIFAIADSLLTDNDDLVQKGYGWMLKAASEAHRDPVFTYLMEKRDVMPRTAFRYALEKMPKDMRAAAMKK